MFLIIILIMIKLFSFLVFFLVFSGCQVDGLDESIIILEKNQSFEPSRLESEIKNISNLSKELIVLVPVENISLNSSYVKNISEIPKEILSENISSRTLSIGDKWQWQLSGKLNFEYVDEVSVYDIDLFDSSNSDIEYLHSNDIFVICYFSGGLSEDWRSDFSEFPESVLGKKLDNWDGERWLDISNYSLFSDVMLTRFDLAVLKGCDGVEVDNIDSYSNINGFSISYSDQIKYNIWLSENAHYRGLLIGLKNNLEQVTELVDYFDFAVNEQCFEYDECELLLPFIDSGKAVFGVEYELPKSKFCSKANKSQFSFLFMTYDLSGERDSCN